MKNKIALTLFFSILWMPLFSNNIKNKNPKILSFFPSMWLGGAEVCCAIMHKYISQQSPQSSILVPHGSPLSKYLNQRKLSHETFPAETSLAKHIKSLCIKKNIDIIQCHSIYNINIAQQATKDLKTKVVLMHHGTQQFPIEPLKGLSGFISTSPENVALVKRIDEEKSLGIKKKFHIFPFFEEDEFKNYSSQEDPCKYFKKAHNIVIEKNTPIICMIANFYQDADINLNEPPFRKNHLLLIKSLAKLINEKKENAHLIFVGDGPTKEWHKDFCKKLGVQNNVHFLGFCNDVRPILFHSDILVLTSLEEPLGIVYLEAALMKKPAIGSSNTGADHAIVNEKTGFVFKNNNLEDLTEKLTILIKNSNLRSTMGKNAYLFVTDKTRFNRSTSPFSNTKKIEIMMKFYKSILKGQ